jgi:hypothetical protein
MCNTIDCSTTGMKVKDLRDIRRGRGLSMDALFLLSQGASIPRGSPDSSAGSSGPGPTRSSSFRNSLTSRGKTFFPPRVRAFARAEIAND